MKTSLLIASLALVAAMPSQALATKTYSRTIVTDRVTSHSEEGFEQVLGGPSSATSSIGAYSATAATDFGVIKLHADAPDAGGYVQAVGYFRDTITLSGAITGGFVPVTLNFLVDGMVTNHNKGVGDWAYQVILDLRGADQNAFQYVSGEKTQFTSATGAISDPVAAVGYAPAGVPLDLTAVFSIYTSGNTIGAFDLDFSHTALLTGIDVADGITVTSESRGLLAANGDGFTYPAVISELDPTSPPSGVPEPSSWALMIVGFGMVGGAMRSKRIAFA